MSGQKENVLTDYLNMIEQSWTFARLTATEKNRLYGLFEKMNNQNYHSHIRGGYDSRWRQLNNLYDAFLSGCGYDGVKWRGGNDALYIVIVSAEQNSIS